MNLPYSDHHPGELLEHSLSEGLLSSLSLSQVWLMADNDDARPLWLLLLPFPPSSISLHTLRIAYGPGLTRALKQASECSSSSSSLIMDIVVFYSDDSYDEYAIFQHFFGIMYKLICVICIEQQIDLQYNNDVDARLMLCRRSSNQIGHPDQNKNNRSSARRSFSDLEKLAKTKRAWKRILSLHSESAESLLQDFLQMRNEGSQQTNFHYQVERLPGGLVIRQNEQQRSQDGPDPMTHHESVAVGGTFDHLHAGHKLLLTMTALVLEPEPRMSRHSSMTIGITGDELLKHKKYRNRLEDFHQRQSATQNFLLAILEIISPRNILESARYLESSPPFGREVLNTFKSGLVIRYVEIFDPCGPTITDEAISALVLSAETRGGGKVVNEKRKEKGWSALDVFEVDVLDTGEDDSSQADSTFQSKISSTDIRRRMQEKMETVNRIF